MGKRSFTVEVPAEVWFWCRRLVAQLLHGAVPLGGTKGGSERSSSDPVRKKTGASTAPSGDPRRARLPDDFLLTPERQSMAVRARVPAVEVAAQFKAFVDYHHAHGSKMVDWNAAWRTWVNNYRRFAPRFSRPPEPGRATPSAEATRRLVRDLDRDEGPKSGAPVRLADMVDKLRGRVEKP